MTPTPKLAAKREVQANAREKHRGWEVTGTARFTLRLGAMTLIAYEDAGRTCWFWLVQWHGASTRGTAATLGGAKRRALEVAKRVLWETAERLALAEGKR